MVRSLATTGMAHVAFWEALGYGVVMLSPRLVALGVALRDLYRRRMGTTGEPRAQQHLP